MNKKQIVQKVKRETGLNIELFKTDGVWYRDIMPHDYFGGNYDNEDRCLHACQLRDINVEALIDELRGSYL